MIRIFFSLMMLFSLSCNEVESLNGDLYFSSDSPLTINASTETFTKGELVNDVESMGSLGLYCAMTGDEKWSSTTEFSKMKDQRYYISNGDEWMIDGDPVAWGFTFSTDKYTFFAYSPYWEDTEGVTPYIDNGELIIKYEVPANSIYQPDLMIATPHKDIYAQVADGVSLNFYHALASVSFGVISTTEQITAIEISGVASEGLLSWDYENDMPEWNFVKSTNSFSVEINGYTPDEEIYTQLNTDRGYLMMIPQELTTDAEVTITLYGGDSKTITIPAGSVWEAGCSYNYVFTFEDETDNFIFNSEQISNCYIINPTEGKDTIVQIPIEDRINDFWENYANSSSTRITSSSKTTEFEVALIWEDFDGTFSFDYEVIDDGDNKMAVLLTIPAQFQEGNFVFAVQEDKNDLMVNLWSWHLWFTSYKPDLLAAVNKGNIEAGVDKEYTISGYEGAVHRYKDADESVNVWSAMYADKFIMDRNIGERNSRSTDYGVYYQFGRKDPFPGSKAWYSNTKSEPYARSSSDQSFDFSVIYAKDFFISNSSSSNHWCGVNESRNNAYIWFDKDILSANYTEGKSIFDPSPLGWRVPVSDTWSSFTSAGSSQDSSDNSKSVGVYNNYGCRDPVKNSALSKVGDAVYVWSANLNYIDTACAFYIEDDSVVLPNVMIVTYGLPIRAVQE